MEAVAMLESLILAPVETEGVSVSVGVAPELPLELLEARLAL